MAQVNADKAKPTTVRKAAPEAITPVAATLETAAEAVAPALAAVAETIVETFAEIKAEVITPKLDLAKLTLNEGTKVMTDTSKKIEASVKATTAQVNETANSMFKDINVRAKAAMEKTGELAKDVVEFNKLNLEAVVEAGKIAARGAQTAAQNVADVGRKNIEDTTAMVKSLSSVKAPADFFKIQGDFARNQFDGAVAEMSKSTEFYLKLAGEVFQPISTRYSVAADAVKARMAA